MHLRPPQRLAAIGLLAVVALSARHAALALRMGAAPSICPDFREYTALHWAAVLAHNEPEKTRWLVTEDQDGLADRLVNAVSTFLLGLLTNRAVCFVPSSVFGHQPGLEVAFDSPFIDWTCRRGTGNGTVNAWEDPMVGEQEVTDTLKWGALDDLGTAFYKAFVLADVGALAKQDPAVWFVKIHRGLSVGLTAYSLAHSEQLERLGLRTETAFGCILGFLFRPKRETLWLVPKPLLSVMTNSRVLKIGIQIRVGDQLIKHSMKDPALPDATYQRAAAPFFACAEQLEADLKAHTGAAEVKWYLMTDTIGVRQKALKKYGRDKLLAFDDTAIEWFKSVTDTGFRLTVMEHWLLQQAHYHIVTATSGLGRSAAYAALRHHNVFTLKMSEHPHHADAVPSARVASRGCKLRDHDSLMEIYSDWSGI